MFNGTRNAAAKSQDRDADDFCTVLGIVHEQPDGVGPANDEVLQENLGLDMFDAGSMRVCFVHR